MSLAGQVDIRRIPVFLVIVGVVYLEFDGRLAALLPVFDKAGDTPGTITIFQVFLMSLIDGALRSTWHQSGPPDSLLLFISLSTIQICYPPIKKGHKGFRFSFMPSRFLSQAAILFSTG